MKTPQADALSISIMGKDFMVACPDQERESLRAAAQYLDGKMREIHDGGRVIGMERTAVMAALNIANELLQARRGGGEIPTEVTQRLKSLQDKIDAALADNR